MGLPEPPDYPLPLTVMKSQRTNGGSHTALYDDGIRISIYSYVGAGSGVSVSRAVRPDGEDADAPFNLHEATFVEIDPLSEDAPEWVRRWYASDD